MPHWDCKNVAASEDFVRLPVDSGTHGPGDDRAFVQGLLGRATRDRAPLDFEHRLVRGDGSTKHLHVRARAAGGSSDALEYVGAVTDVTALRHSQHARETAFREVQTVKEEFRLAVDTIPGLVWSALPDGQVDFLNQRWREYTAIPELNANANAVAIESLKIELEGWDRDKDTKEPNEADDVPRG